MECPLKIIFEMQRLTLNLTDFCRTPQQYAVIEEIQQRYYELQKDFEKDCGTKNKGANDAND